MAGWGAAALPHFPQQGQRSERVASRVASNTLSYVLLCIVLALRNSRGFGGPKPKTPLAKHGQRSEQGYEVHKAYRDYNRGNIVVLIRVVIGVIMGVTGVVRFIGFSPCRV